jgi:hypothetical protein
LLEAAAHCIADPRNPLLIKHAVADMLRQRVYGLALGWEDLNDHSALRCDVAMQTGVGVDDAVASVPTLCRLEKWADKTTAFKLHQVLVEQFIANFKTTPEPLEVSASPRPPEPPKPPPAPNSQAKQAASLRGKSVNSSQSNSNQKDAEIPPLAMGWTPPPLTAS